MDESKALETFAAIAFQYGPFFFSIFFLLVVVGMAHKRFKKVNMRTDPEATLEEKKCYKMYFVASFAASLLLVFISVGWWMYAHMSKHVLRGTIYGLQEGYTLFTQTDDIYIRTTLRLVTDEKKMVDYHFAIVRDDPFHPGQKFVFIFYPEAGVMSDRKPEGVRFNIVYSGEEKQSYEIKKEGQDFILAKNE